MDVTDTQELREHLFETFVDRVGAKHARTFYRHAANIANNGDPIAVIQEKATSRRDAENQVLRLAVAAMARGYQGHVCDRCGGCGRYGHYGVCFDCGGRGWMPN